MHSFQTIGRCVRTLSYAFFALGFAQLASANVLYQEDFSTTGSASIDTAGWFGYAGSSCTDVSSTTNGTATLYSSIIDGGAQGHAATWPGLGDGQVLAGTSKFSSIDLSRYNDLAFSWCQCINDLSLKSQAAVKIGNNCYVSQTTYTNAATYTERWDIGHCVVTSGVEWKSISLSSAKWYQMTMSPGSSMNVDTTQLVDLPTTGSIAAAGLYTTGSSGVLCFDTFRISSTAVPEPSTMMLVLSGVLGLLAYAWRKRK
jgi:hypothetical protein